MDVTNQLEQIKSCPNCVNTEFVGGVVSSAGMGYGRVKKPSLEGDLRTHQAQLSMMACKTCGCVIRLFVNRRIDWNEGSPNAGASVAMIFR
ncbi:hypothetical protein [Alicyclobacillus sp. ALC3]|uniref:hypothetical protein n=1 Tax=Alicyclobacillus sp. ALC3 TaxID=2796143 RepID=UPI002378D614|nr:hypothetical protein [Alicyclobacillus sp. ALC3]WDL99208.1 hypothetical protein JC200_11505 [Alicyclobacillus sp. ALC3]